MKTKIIRVWSCCGEFGWDLPWAHWHADGVYAQPPDDLVASYVYIYSLAGQPDAARAHHVDPTAKHYQHPDRVIGAINVDDFASYGIVRWHDVLAEVKRIVADKELPV